MFTLRAEDAGFIERAPLRLVFAATLQSGAKEVFTALSADASTWPGWFAAVKRSEYGGDGPYGVGTRRRVVLHGGPAFHETVIAWDDPTRYAYRVDRCTVPGLRALAEEWALVETNDGTRIRWTMAIDAVTPLALVLRANSPGLGIAFRRAVAVLDRQLTAGR